MDTTYIYFGLVEGQFKKIRSKRNVFLSANNRHHLHLFVTDLSEVVYKFVKKLCTQKCLEVHCNYI